MKKICQNIISQQIAGMSFFEMIQNHKEEKNEQKEINKNWSIDNYFNKKMIENYQNI